MRKRRLVIRHKKIDYIKQKILKKSRSYEQKSNDIDNLIERDIKFFTVIIGKELKELNDIQ